MIAKIRPLVFKRQEEPLHRLSTISPRQTTTRLFGVCTWIETVHPEGTNSTWILPTRLQMIVFAFTVLSRRPNNVVQTTPTDTIVNLQLNQF